MEDNGNGEFYKSFPSALGLLTSFPRKPFSFRSTFPGFSSFALIYTIWLIFKFSISLILVHLSLVRALSLSLCVTLISLLRALSYLMGFPFFGGFLQIILRYSSSAARPNRSAAKWGDFITPLSKSPIFVDFLCMGFVIFDVIQLWIVYMFDFIDCDLLYSTGHFNREYNLS